MGFEMHEDEKIRRVKQVIWISGIFTALVSLLLILNYLQIRASEPLESVALKMLVERLSAEPANQALMEEIRQLDLLARKAYFNSLWYIHTGAYLLLIGSIALIAALQLYFTLRFSIDKPSHELLKEKQKRQKAQRWIALAGAVVIVSAGLSALFTADHLQQFESGSSVAEATDPGIEQVDITRQPGMTQTRAETVESTESVEITTTDDEVHEDEVAGGASVKPVPVARKPLTVEAVRRNHNAFRGAWGNGNSARRNIPTNWDGTSGNNILWKTEIPIHGYNSPILWEDRLYMSSANNTKRVVYCLDRHTGKILWERVVNNIPGSPATPPRTTEDTGLAAPTLTTEGNIVVAIFGTGDIIAFDMEGDRLWARNLGVPANHYGHSSSLLTWDGKVFVQYDTMQGARLMALNINTGQTIWETPRDSGVSWASPLLVEVNGKYQIVLSANPDVAAYDISTGQKLWSVNCMSGEVGPSPAYGGGLVYAGNEYAKLVAINPANGELVWDDNYYLPEVSSPVYHDGLLYIATSYAVFACFDATNGEFLWEFDAENGFYSSPVIADGKIYIFDLDGQAYVFQPGREANLISSPVLGEKVFATPVFADGRLYIRGNRNLYCIGNE
jgi:outer membrane protein assembly factor BamB